MEILLLFPCPVLPFSLLSILVNAVTIQQVFPISSSSRGLQGHACCGVVYLSGLCAVLSLYSSYAVFSRSVIFSPA